jgi:hypothetical protein
LVTQSATTPSPRRWTPRPAMRPTDPVRRSRRPEAQRRMSTAGLPCACRSARVCGPHAMVKKS